VLKAVKRLGLLSGDTVLVAGQGPIGLMFTRLLKLQGVKVIATDLMASRLRLAKKFGAKWTTSADQLSTFDSRLDAAVVTVPSDAVAQQAVQLVRGAGKILLFAHTRRGERLEIDPATVCVDEKDLLGSYSSDFTLQREVARLVFSRRLDVRPLITHHFPLEQTAQAIALASRPIQDSLKVVVSNVAT
jgi:L-iditol 2-dehydrogenase